MELGLPATFTEWASKLGYSVFREDDGVILADEGGELRYHLRPDPAGIALLKAERAEDPTPVLIAARIDDAIRYLVTVLGDDHRAMNGFSTVRLPFDWSAPAPGYTAVDLGAGWTALWQREGEAPVISMVDQDVVHPVIMFSYVASASIADLITSYEDPEGEPLLKRFVG